MPIKSRPSTLGTSHVGPTVMRSEYVSCSTIAATIVAWTGQKGSLAPGGG
jgi:hypothetical protein